MSKQTTGTFGDHAVRASFAINGNDNELVEMGVDPGEIVSDRAKLRANEVSLIRTRLASSADGHLSSAARKLVGSPTGKLSDSDYREFSGRVSNAVRLARLDRDLETIEQQYRSQVRVVAEVDPYGKGSPHSWLRDRLAARDSSGFGVRGDGGHEERLRRHGAIVARAVERRSKYGRMIEAQLREQYRQ